MSEEEIELRGIIRAASEKRRELAYLEQRAIQLSLRLQVVTPMTTYGLLVSSYSHGAPTPASKSVLQEHGVIKAD